MQMFSLKRATRPTFAFIFVLLIQFTETVDFSGIQTQIVGVEGEGTDNLTTTTAI